LERCGRPQHHHGHRSSPIHRGATANLASVAAIIAVELNLADLLATTVVGPFGTIEELCGPHFFVPRLGPPGHLHGHRCGDSRQAVTTTTTKPFSPSN
jgi:hypothetical protein